MMTQFSSKASDHMENVSSFGALLGLQPKTHASLSPRDAQQQLGSFTVTLPEISGGSHRNAKRQVGFSKQAQKSKESSELHWGRPAKCALELCAARGPGVCRVRKGNRACSCWSKHPFAEDAFTAGVF
ncbi:hypothetical protein CYMTET_56712 [Cymbomonas tetramitiformis]|uniref:Uncharacterized protein n=1 Tax=Cymbomonas tetramitiformis TaxID=36881 RepID=A0AAE0BBV6_9CHLO|nr:hypothetical protein CYMTET_56712 [Cymbomonas tetramitiformis]